MRVLVTSDTHGSALNFKQAVLSQPTAELVIHLGDGEEDVWNVKRSFPEKTFLQVRGNCDWASSLPNVGLYTAETPERSVSIFYTHGHLYNVKDGLYYAVCAAREQRADVLLFGHTHQPLCDYEDGLYIMNPGALSGLYPSYGYIDITPQGIVTNTVRL